MESSNAIKTPEGFPSKAKGYAYPRYPGKGVKIIANPGRVAYFIA